MKTKLLLLVALWLSIATQPTAQSIFVAGALASTTHLNAHVTSPTGLPPATELTIDCTTPGSLNSLISDADKQTIVSLTLTGTIDQRDFVTMNSLMPALKIINLQGVQIAAYDKSPTNTIPTKAFAGNTRITTIAFPSLLKTIASEAFQNCTNLSGELKLPETIESIEPYAFRNCPNLTGALVLPEEMKEVEYNSFQNCTGFTSLTIPNRLEVIEEFAFAGCTKLSGELKLPTSLKMIHNSAFEGCKGFTGKLEIPTMVSDIGANAFKDCSGFTGLLTLSDNLKTIGSSAFEGCNNLTGNINIPKTVTTIGSQAFQGCVGFKGTLNFNNAKVDIQQYAFANCSGLTGDLSLPETIVAIGTRAFEKCSGFNGTLTLPKNTRSIRPHTFSQCSGLTGVLNIPSSVVSINSSAFAGCSSLTGLEMNESLTDIGNNAFKDCSNMEGTITFPSSLKNIGDFAFTNCGKLRSIIIPESVTSIGSAAFQGLRNLKTLHANNIDPINIKLSPFVFWDTDESNDISKTECILYVPNGSVDKYKAAEQWKEFFQINVPENNFCISSTSVILDAPMNSTAKVAVAANLKWIATSNDPSWLEVSQNTFNKENGEITITAKSENTWVPRTATITVAAENNTCKTIKVTQKSSIYKEDLKTIVLTDKADGTAPIVDQKSIKVKVSPNAGNTRYFRFMPTKDETMIFKTEAEFGAFRGIIQYSSNLKLTEESCNYSFNGNCLNVSLTLGLPGMKNQLFYLGLTPIDDGNDIVPMTITGGELQSFIWKSNGDNKWSTTNNWNWGSEKIMPQPWNMGTIDDGSTVNVDVDVNISMLKLLQNSKTIVTSNKSLYICDTLTNNGTIENNGVIFVGGALMNYGSITKKGTIHGPIFAPVYFESNGGNPIETKMYQYGIPFNLPSPTKEGYIFEGWHADAALKDNAIASNTPMSLNSMRLYAKWEKHPKVSISEQNGVTNITTTSASITSKIDDIGIPELTEYGIVWSTTANPTTSSPTKLVIANKAVNIPVISNITGLTTNTTYYVRAYADHKCGVVYSNEVSFTTQAIPVIEWIPIDITYGMKLDGEQFKAKATFNSQTVEGTFTYSHEVGYAPNAGDLVLTAKFKPTDKAKYCEVEKSITIKVAKATPVINWENPQPITYGTLLGKDQLKALATLNGSEVLGTYEYTPSFNALFSAGKEQKICVVFTPTDQANYVEKTSKEVSIIVNPATPEISWETPAPIVYGTPIPAEYLKATATHNSVPLKGKFVYNHNAGETLPCLEHDLTVSFVAMGNDSNPDPNYTATSKTVKLVVTQATPVISWNTPAPISYGTPLGADQLKATAKFKESVLEGTFTYSCKTGEILPAGTKEIMATFAPKDDLNFKSASQKVTLTINKAKLINSKPSVVVAKLYDGNINAEITNAGTLTNVVKADIGKVAATATAKYDNAAVGKNKVITVTYLISGEASNNYIAPDSYIINGAAISEKIRLKELKVAQAGCEGEKITLPYTVESGEPTEYLLTFSDNAAAAGFKNTSFAALPSNAVTFDIPSKLPDGIYTASLILKDGNGIASDLFPFQFTINVSSDIIITKFGSVVLINNKDKRFAGYQWFKDGNTIDGATKQFYKDPSGLKGAYTAQLKTSNGQTLNTCPKKLSLQPSEQANLNVYPNPVKAGQPCSIKLSGFSDQELADAVLVVYNMQGTPVYTSHKLAQDNTITLSGVDGVYMGRISISNSEPLTFKIIMAN